MCRMGQVRNELTMKSVDYKVPKGKLLRISADVKKKRIKDIRIYGDFFIYPEESISVIEDTLKGQMIDDRLNQKLLNATREFNMIGVSVDDIVHVLDKFIK